MNYSQKTPAQIAKRNAAFQKATNAQKRVIIAKEVILQLNARRFSARCGTFCLIPDNEMESQSGSIQQLFNENKISSCFVCALGGLMMATTILNNNEDMTDFQHDFCDLGQTLAAGESPKNGLRKFFSMPQLKLIERAFEGKGFGYFSIQNKKAENFGKKTESEDRHNDASKRMLAIMKNIIRNKGTFKP